MQGSPSVFIEFPRYVIVSACAIVIEGLGGCGNFSGGDGVNKGSGGCGERIDGFVACLCEECSVPFIYLRYEESRVGYLFVVVCYQVEYVIRGLSQNFQSFEGLFVALIIF